MFRRKKWHTKHSIDHSANIPGRTSFHLSIKHLLPFEGKTIPTVFAKPNRNRQTILRCRQFRIRTSFSILKVGLLKGGLFFSGNESLRHLISRKVRRQMWSLLGMARGFWQGIPDTHGHFLSRYCRNLNKTAILLNSVKREAEILTSSFSNFIKHNI